MLSQCIANFLTKSIGANKSVNCSLQKGGISTAGVQLLRPITPSSSVQVSNEIFTTAVQLRIVQD